MNVQELEEQQHGDGYRDEWQRQFAYECSQREPRSRDLSTELNDGKFCVVADGPDYCPHTDAIMGQKESLCSAHDDREAAESALREILQEDDPYGEINFYILPKAEVKRVVRVADLDDDVPF